VTEPSLATLLELAHAITKHNSAVSHNSLSQITTYLKLTLRNY